jgi:hypothetical protein
MAFALASTSMDVLDKSAFMEYAKRFIQEYDYIFYVSPEGVEMEDNGVRETDLEYRKTIDELITITLSKNKNKIKNYGILEGPTEQRIEQMKFQLGL